MCERKRAPRARAETDTAEGQGPAAETVRRCGPAGFGFHPLFKKVPSKPVCVFITKIAREANLTLPEHSCAMSKSNQRTGGGGGGGGRGAADPARSPSKARPKPSAAAAAAAATRRSKSAGLPFAKPGAIMVLGAAMVFGYLLSHGGPQRTAPYQQSRRRAEAAPRSAESATSMEAVMDDDDSVVMNDARVNYGQSADEAPPMDLHDNCAAWAAEGRCTDEFAPFMKTNCAGSCSDVMGFDASSVFGRGPSGRSGGGSVGGFGGSSVGGETEEDAEDEDKSEHCAIWAESGECEN